MKKYFYIVAVLLLFVNIFSVEASNVPYHEANIAKKNQIMSVKHHVEGNDVFVECVISNFTFTNRLDEQNGQKNSGFLELYVDGKKIKRIHTAAFIIKSLPKGIHHIKLVLVQQNGAPFGIEKEWKVQI